MVHRTPARWIAPLALVGAIAAVLIVISSDTGKSSSSSSAATITSSSSTTSTTPQPSSVPHHGRFYVVKSGDVMSGIAARTGVSLSRLTELNPNVDAQSLYPGQKLKLVP